MFMCVFLFLTFPNFFSIIDIYIYKQIVHFFCVVLFQFLFFAITYGFFPFFGCFFVFYMCLFFIFFFFIINGLLLFFVVVVQGLLYDI